MTRASVLQSFSSQFDTASLVSVSFIFLKFHHRRPILICTLE